MLPAAGSSGHPPSGYAGDAGLPARPIATGALVIAAALALAVASIPAAAPHALLPAVAGASLVACALAVWAAGRARRREAGARAECRHLADRLAQETALRESLAEATPDLVAIKEPDRRYRYDNAALAAALGRPVDGVLGCRDEDLFAPNEAATLAAADEAALRLGLPTRSEDGLRLGGEARRGTSVRYLHSARVPLRTSDGDLDGLLWVARDVSELVAQRDHRERLRGQAIAALAQAVELADPYLVGHSGRVRDTALGIAWRLGLGEEERLAVELAASLSQVGKIFLPPEILRKPGRHNARERAVMRSHVDRTLEIVRSIGLEPAVVDALAQAHERLDGSGYPAGLRGEAIGTPGRVLAAADVFCARTAPRAHRNAEAPAAVLLSLRGAPERFDVAVVEALADAIEVPSGVAAP